MPPAPLDERGMPLPIITPSDYVPVPRAVSLAGGLGSNEETVAWENKHHGLFCRRTLASLGPAGNAVRESWVQRIYVSLHDKFHEIFTDVDIAGSYRFSDINQEVFRRLPLCFSGYLPNYGVDPTSNNPTEPIWLEPADKLLISTQVTVNRKFNPRTKVVEAPKYVTDFMVNFIADNFVASEGMEHLQQTAIERPKRLKKRARTLARLAISESCSFCQPTYNEAFRAGQIVRYATPDVAPVVWDFLNTAELSRSAVGLVSAELIRRSSVATSGK